MESPGTLQASHIVQSYPPNSPSRDPTFPKAAQGELATKSHPRFTSFTGQQGLNDSLNSHPTHLDQNGKYNDQNEWMAFPLAHNFIYACLYFDTWYSRNYSPTTWELIRLRNLG